MLILPFLCFVSLSSSFSLPFIFSSLLLFFFFSSFLFLPQSPLFLLLDQGSPKCRANKQTRAVP
jgi:hypothetical protein